MRFFKYHLDTFGVESVVITNTTGGRVCLDCSFYSFSADTGCTVELVSSGIVRYTETINRSGNGTAEGCISDITRGQYDISVYDQSSHMLFETFTGVNVTGETATTTTTPGRTTTSTTASTRGTRDSTNIIAGIVYIIYPCSVSILKIIHVILIKCLILTVIIKVKMIVYTDICIFVDESHSKILYLSIHLFIALLFILLLLTLHLLYIR